MRHAAGLIVASGPEIRRVQSAYGVPAERIAYVPNALDTRHWQASDRRAARAALGIPLDVGVVVWHGRVEIHSKGLDILLDAWDRLYRDRAGDRPLLVLVGSAQHDAAMRERVALFPPGAIRWEDRYELRPELIRRYLSASDIATKPSRAEGFSVAVIEAMACGLPVVATAVSGVADALGGDAPAGVIVPPDDPAALAEALGRLLDDEPLRRTLGTRARRRAEERFSLEVVGGQLRTFMERRGAFRPAG
jgi:glycosyltransferase involved in cell wall biosynthesis